MVGWLCGWLVGVVVVYVVGVVVPTVDQIFRSRANRCTDSVAVFLKVQGFPIYLRTGRCGARASV